MVVKKDGRREEFSRDKVRVGIQRSVAKLPVSSRDIDAILDDIESALHVQGVAEVPYYEIGDMVMERLRELNHVAYVRFASHYKDFLSLEELQELQDEFSRLAQQPRRAPRRAGAAQPPLLPVVEIDNSGSPPVEGAERPPRRARR
jgi:transcriptional repressor NrdR